MSRIKHIIQRIKEGRLKQLIAELLWMYAYVRRYWLLIGIYILLGASGSVLSLGTSVVSKDLVDAVTGVNSLEIVRVAATYVGVGVSQIFINAVKSIPVPVFSLHTSIGSRTTVSPIPRQHAEHPWHPRQSVRAISPAEYSLPSEISFRSMSLFIIPRIRSDSGSAISRSLRTSPPGPSQLPSEAHFSPL